MEGEQRPNKKRFVSLSSAPKLVKVPQNLAPKPPPPSNPFASKLPSGFVPNKTSSSSSSSFPPPKPPSANDARRLFADRLFSSLSFEQQFFAKQVGSQSVFLSGAAGTGKSTLFRYLVAAAKCRFKNSGVAITGSTGVAAVGVGGTTVHQWSGVGRAEGEKEDILNKVRANKNAVVNWLKCQVLFIDEISMISASLFELLSWIGCSIRQNFEKPFGGIQVIVCGDFHQLPPVDRVGGATFAFESKEWKQLFPSKENWIVLKTVVRQKDPDFVRILSKVREGDTSCLEEINKRCFRKLNSDDGIFASRLYCRNIAVDAMNKVCLLSLVVGLVLGCFIDFSKRRSWRRSKERLKSSSPWIL